MAIRRRWCISLAGLAIAAVPAGTMAATGATAATGASAATGVTAATGAPAATAAARASAAHLTVTHGPVARDGQGLRLATPGGAALSAHGASHAATTSTNWSGYVATGATFSSVSATWVQPAVTCRSGDQYASFWVGLDGYTSNSVEQDGTDSDCSGSTPQYYGWYEMYPKPSYDFGGSVSPGDTISASVTYSGTNSYTLTLADESKGWSTSTTKKLAKASRSSAEVIIEAPYSGGVLPLADFGTVHFSDVLANGSPIGSFSPDSIDMINGSGADKATVSSLSGGENFSATWISAN
jgi:hypothetical protein